MQHYLQTGTIITFAANKKRSRNTELIYDSRRAQRKQLKGGKGLYRLNRPEPPFSSSYCLGTVQKSMPSFPICRLYWKCTMLAAEQRVQEGILFLFSFSFFHRLDAANLSPIVPSFGFQYHQTSSALMRSTSDRTVAQLFSLLVISLVVVSPAGDADGVRHRPTDLSS